MSRPRQLKSAIGHLTPKEAYTINHRLQRLGSIALAAGALLFGAASLFHPPTVNPWDPRVSLAKAIQAAWIIDHWALLVAVTLVHLGLFAMHSLMRVISGGRYRSIAFALGIASLALWLAIFLFEATGWPILAKAIAAPGGSGLHSAASLGATLDVVARALWATSLSLGYAAAFLFGLATMLWSLDLVVGRRLPGWLSRWGVIAGGFTAVVQPLSLSAPSVALWLLIPAAALLGAWLLAAAWHLWHGMGVGDADRLGSSGSTAPRE